MTDKEPHAGDMLSPNEAGKILGVSGKTVIRLMEDGKIAGYRIGFVHKFRRGDVIDYLLRARIEPKKEQPETED